MADAFKEDLVYCVFECFAGLKLRLVRRTYLNCFAGSRITTRCRFAMRDRERTETYEPNFAFVPQRSGNVVKNTIDGTGSVNF